MQTTLFIIPLLPHLLYLCCAFGQFPVFIEHDFLVFAKVFE